MGYGNRKRIILAVISVTCIVLVLCFVYWMIHKEKDIVSSSGDISKITDEYMAAIGDCEIQMADLDGNKIYMLGHAYDLCTGIGYALFETEGEHEIPIGVYDEEGNELQSEKMLSYENGKSYMYYRFFVSEPCYVKPHFGIKGKDNHATDGGDVFSIDKGMDGFIKKTLVSEVIPEKVGGCISPLGIWLESELQDIKKVTIVYKNGKETEQAVKNVCVTDTGNNIYLCCFKELADVENISSIIVSGTEYELEECTDFEFMVTESLKEPLPFEMIISSNPFDYMDTAFYKNIIYMGTDSVEPLDEILMEDGFSGVQAYLGCVALEEITGCKMLDVTDMSWSNQGEFKRLWSRVMQEMPETLEAIQDNAGMSAEDKEEEMKKFGLFGRAYASKAAVGDFELRGEKRKGIDDEELQERYKDLGEGADSEDLDIIFEFMDKGR